ncbi:MAG: GtrA family protein [Actinobacteria bacterium]|jgi:putative flippase GtrA|nr:GtrA family protein [Actinomycetota bacterium]MCL6104898.1 GtrA family protein [Actinomycetota bacterium]
MMQTKLKAKLPRKWQVWLSSSMGIKIVRYTLTSVISTVVSFGILYIVYDYKLLGAVASAVLANAVATVPSYYLNRQWAWQKSGPSHFWREVIPFWVTSFAGLGFSMLTVALASHYGPDFVSSHQTMTLLIDFANLFAYGVMWVGKFVFYNLWLFNK